MKKFLLSIGSISTVFFPTILAVSCSGDDTPTITLDLTKPYFQWRKDVEDVLYDAHSPFQDFNLKIITGLGTETHGSSVEEERKMINFLFKQGFSINYIIENLEYLANEVQKVDH